MAQHDYVIANQPFPSYRNDHNNSLSAVVSKNSGASAPSTTYAYQWWYDSTNDILKIRNADNDAWINFASFDQSNDNFSLTVQDLTVNGTGVIPSGTKMLFQQTSAPTGFTKLTTHNNKALRVVSGTASTGGTNSFTNAFNSSKTVSGTTGTSSVTISGTTASHTLTVDQIPSHTHTHPGHQSCQRVLDTKMEQIESHNEEIKVVKVELILSQAQGEVKVTLTILVLHLEVMLIHLVIHLI
jgi:hypothetical protein